MKVVEAGGGEGRVEARRQLFDVQARGSRLDENPDALPDQPPRAHHDCNADQERGGRVEPRAKARSREESRRHDHE